MAASSKEGSVLDCPICLEKLRNPKYLPCLHTFCELCIQSFIESSISDCVKKCTTISFDCPVCRRVIPPPINNISAKEWTEELPINHQILESFQIQTASGQEVFCDSCRQNDDQVIATIRCQQCKENLCKVCCKFIHKRVRAFGLHTFVDLRSINTEFDTRVVPGNCLIHRDKPIEVYCFDHGELCCIYCLTTIHKECKAVLSLDELDEKDLEISSKSCTEATKQIRDLTACNILDTKKYINDLNQEKNEVLENVTKTIEDLKQRLDHLYSKFQNSLRSTYEKETSDLSFVLKTLEDFDSTLAQSENIASTFMESGTKKQIFIATEKIKHRLSDHLESMTSKTKDFKRSKVKWIYVDVVERLNELTKLGDMKCTTERFDFITPIKKHYNAMEKDGNLREKAKEKKISDEKQRRKICAPDSLIPSNRSEIQDFYPEVYTYSGGIAAQSNVLLVAAIDFGNTFSGYAFATRNDVEKDLLKSRVPYWCASDGGFILYKTPSIVLLNMDAQFVDFGFEAESKYTDLLENGEGEDYFYFHHFKMMLNDLAKTKSLTIHTKLSDIRGRELPAVTVFAYAIKYLKDHFLKELEKTGLGALTRDDIKWVLTVPAIWDENAKLFLRNAAHKAGITTNQLIIALETEVASIYCRNLPAEKLEGTNTFNVFRTGSKYFYLDAGGGSVDITVLEVMRNGNIKELDRLSNGVWGGTSVDMAFKRALAEIVTVEMIESYSKKYPDDYLSLFRDFENRKRSCRKGQACSLKIPLSFNKECLKTLGTDLNTLINNSKYKDNFIWRTGRLKIDSFETFFQSACDGIIKLLKELLQSPKLKDVNTILMAGGFSESCIIQEALRNAFPHCQIIVPIEAGLAVLRGAVMYGFHPPTISSRIARYTYGVDTNARFDPSVHEESKKEVIDGVEYCTGLFDKLVGIGDQISSETASCVRYYIPLTRGQNSVSFGIYSSTEMNPIYVEHCTLIGKIEVKVPVGLKIPIIEVRMIFGSTEFIVKVSDLDTKKCVTATFDLLDR